MLSFVILSVVFLSTCVLSLTAENDIEEKRQAPGVMRFGRSDPQMPRSNFDLDMSSEADDAMAANVFRYVRAGPGVMRFGKRGGPGVMRFGKRSAPGVMRFGKRQSPGVMRFGKRQSPGVMRFGKRYSDDMDLLEEERK